MASKEPKQYGLILAKKDQKNPLLLNKPSIFDDDSDESEEKSVGKSIINQGLKNLQKKQTQLEMQRALEEDPTVYEYDEVFDSMQKKKEVLKTVQIKDRKPKYIDALLKSAEQRKKDYERRIERKIQKEREAEGNEFADKEAFVTSAYKQKMIEMQEEEERERKQNEIDAKNDVTKQDDLSTFYRHILKEKVGEGAETPAEPEPTVQIKEEKIDEETEETVTAPSTSHDNSNLDEAARMALARHRNRKTTEPTHPENIPESIQHDSEGSVDSASSSSSSEQSDGGEEKKNRSRKRKNGNDSDSKSAKARRDSDANVGGDKTLVSTDGKGSVDLEITSVAGVEVQDNKENQNENDKVSEAEKGLSTAERVRNLFKKRNVGELYEAAKERYLLRKAARENVKMVFNQG